MRDDDYTVPLEGLWEGSGPGQKVFIVRVRDAENVASPSTNLWGFLGFFLFFLFFGCCFFGVGRDGGGGDVHFHGTKRQCLTVQETKMMVV